jgi:hypothetical protein
VETACPGAHASRTEVRRDEGVAAPGEGLDEHFSRLQLSLALAIGSSANHMEISGGCVCGGTSFGFAQDRLYQMLMVDPPSAICIG